MGAIHKSGIKIQQLASLQQLRWQGDLFSLDTRSVHVKKRAFASWTERRESCVLTPERPNPQPKET
jgi:hypothetical protein